MQLGVGDRAVYGGHGTGRVVAREKRGSDGTRCEVVVLEFADGLLVTLPIARAQEQLRPLVSELEIAGIGKMLRVAPPPDDEAWVRRRKLTQEKLAAGTTIGLAEVVRDNACRDVPVPAGGRSRLSPSERVLYLKARRLLANEIGVARGVQPAEAEDWIARQLALANGDSA
jgi:RNA polymerase-interacting CarD/CdnL/TRCF family regulator